MKIKTVYNCQACGHQHAKWSGRCSQCGEWNTVVEEKEVKTSASSRRTVAFEKHLPQPIAEITTHDVPRYIADLPEFDRVLGGGLVIGSVVLLGGEPGIGKSTLLLQAAQLYAQSGKRVLYVTGEESPSQIALRAERIAVSHPDILIVSETQLETIHQYVEKYTPQILILDSIQTLYSQQLESQPGSVAQLRECTFQIIQMAKQKGISTFLVGHVTKEGVIAGPKLLEHMVDVVLSFDVTDSQTFRLLRAVKNRFGSTNEVGIFEIQNKGLISVTNPSELFLSQRQSKTPGSAIVATIEGTRPLLVEVQALASQSALPMPRRTTIGIDSNRVSLLVAILEKRGGFRFFDQDIYVNVAGGIRLIEPATDLGVVAALISSFSGKPISSDALFFGEVGLGGEIRNVPRGIERLQEAKRIGLKTAYLPEKLVKEVKSLITDVELISLNHIQNLADRLV